MTTPFERVSAQKAALEQENDDLRQEVAELRRLVEANADAVVTDKLMRHFRLTPQEAWLVAALFEAGGKTVTKWALEENMPGQDHAGEREIKIIDVIVCKCRRKLGATCIGTAWAQGYYMASEGLEKLSEVLARPISAAPPHAVHARLGGPYRSLTDAQAAEALELAGRMPALDIAIHLGVGETTIRWILDGRTYKHIPRPAA